MGDRIAAGITHFVFTGLFTDAFRLIGDTVDGNGRVLTTEVMVGTSAVKNLILEDKIHMIPGAIQSAHQLGMHTLNDDLVRLNNLGLISRKTALDAAYDPQDLEKVLGVSNFGF